MEDEFECPGEYLEGCICILKSPGVFKDLGKEQGFDETEVRNLALKRYRSQGFGGEKLERKVEEVVGSEYRKAFEEYGLQQRVASALYRLSSLEPGDGELWEKQGYGRERIIGLIKEEMLDGLVCHVCDCAFCMEGYQEFLKEQVKDRVLSGEYPVLGDGGAQDDFESPEFVKLKQYIDSMFLNIYDRFLEG